MSIESWLIAIHLISTLLMVGVIWFVQIVHYPLMREVGDDGFVEYARRHQQTTSYVVGPLMLLEAGTGVTLAAMQFGREGWQPAWWMAHALLLLIWVSTLLIQMPIHGKLLQGPNPSLVMRLVRTNWIRTIGWTARAALIASQCTLGGIDV
jgi:hypothetical protein